MIDTTADAVYATIDKYRIINSRKIKKYLHDAVNTGLNVCFLEIYGHWV